MRSFPSIPKICPAVLSMLPFNLSIIVRPVAAQSVFINSFAKAAINLMAASARYGAFSTSDAASSNTIFPPPCTISPILFAAMLMLRTIILVTPAIRSGNPDNTFATAGSKFPAKNVMVVSPSAARAGPTSIPSAICPITFLAAAFMEFMEPYIVVAAAFAVVPVMSSSP